MTAAIDITAGQRKTLLALLRRYIPGVAVWAYGSRVKWTARPNSDLDLVAFTTPEQQPLVSELKEALAESDLPFLVDFHVWDDVPERFHEIIRKEYVVFQEAEEKRVGSGMAGDWIPSTLADVSSDVSYGYTESATGVKVGPRFLRITDIQNGVVDWGNVPYCPISEANHRKYRLDQGDIVVARTGNSTGENFLYRGNEDAVFASYLIRFRVDRQKAEPAFVWYNLRSDKWWDFINNSKTGSAQAGANAKILGQFPIRLPLLSEQKAIAHILGTLDDKIELNRRMNATLEAMARALFQSWFVDFDPVRAKLDGRQPASLDAATAALFPAHFQESTLGHIPQGWTIEQVGDVVECVGGGTPSTAEPKFWEGGTHHWTTPKDFSSLQAPILLDTDRKITDAGVAKISSGLLPAGTLLLSSRAPVGYLAIAAMPVAINQGFIAIKCNERASNFFMLNWCQANMAEIESRATGTTFAEISKTNFRPILVELPPKELMVAFTEKVAPLYEQITANLQQSRTLATIRDALLPKLLSGELRVFDEKNKTLEVAHE